MPENVLPTMKFSPKTLFRSAVLNLSRTKIIILLLFSACFNCLSQVEADKQGNPRWYTFVRTLTEKEAINYEFKNTDYNEGYNIKQSRQADTVILEYFPPEAAKPHVLRKVTFPKGDVADFDQLVFLCDSCTMKYVNEIIATKMYDWKEVEPNIYFSNPSGEWN
jgi:hypothetical protein